MLLAVEGGGFFSSSASGYSKGLTLLLLGQKREEKLMRVTPWNQYQLVDQEMDPDLQLASGKNWLARGCASFVCFGQPTELESSSPMKVGSAQNQEVLPEPPDVDSSDDKTNLGDNVVEDNVKKIVNLKSSLKKSMKSDTVAVIGGDDDEKINEHETICDKEKDDTCQIDRRKVQWTDTTGGELFEIREFEMR